jgi:hypothetical protein
MAGQERSEGVVLCGTVDYLKKLLQERRAMIGALEANGVNVEPHLKKYVSPTLSVPGSFRGVYPRSFLQGARATLGRGM